MNILDPISLPLNQSVLIEASAGTGKTYTMANLYLRLILGVGCEPLSAEQILVVTFTKAATQELRDRIRAKLGNVAKWFENPEDKKIREELNIEGDQFLAQLFEQVKDDLATAQLRLKIAERDMDLASIFTIDSFCQKMLFQYAFDSGMRFDIDLQPDESELLARLSEETWRELFYSLSLAESELVSSHLKTPENALKLVRNYLSGELPEVKGIQQNLKDFAKEKAVAIKELKDFWLTSGSEITALISNELSKKYPPKTPKSLSRRSYTEAKVAQYLANMAQWANSDSLDFPAEWEKFTQSFITSKAEADAEPLTSLLFEQAGVLAENFAKHYSDKQQYNILIVQFLTHLRKKLQAYKQSHKEKSFNDITDFMHKSLMSESGERFAQAIRSQFRFAMIDEFQDTNLAQYEIFQRIFMQKLENQGFVMIGDPKQSIYKFRNADIFSYLAAAKKVGEENTYGMDKNWRSAPQIVDDINRLFDFQNNGKSPFIYDGIQFQNVGSDEKNDLLQGESLTNCYLMPEYKMDLAAEYAAYQIQQQLKQAEQGTLFLQKNGEKQPLASKDIAILVRGKYEAEAVKNALARRNIRAIYLSARDSVFESQEAQELLLILQACLNPYHQGSLLAALGSGIFNLDAAQIFHLKNNEQSWDSCVNDFTHYQNVWRKQGILPMLHEIYLKQGIIQRLNSTENSERRITDLLHLAELLQEAMIELRSETALVKWFQQQIQEPNGNADEQRLRLESEQALIKIITIHGSKGLEYPVVWLPFIAEPSKEFKEVGAFGKKNTPTTYHNENNELCWAFSPVSEQEKAALNREEFAEDLRLLYVALTRAKHQLNFILPESFEEKWNSISYLLGNGDIAEQLDTKTRLSQKSLQCEVIDYPENMEDEWQAITVEPNELQAKTFTGAIRAKGQITSFTALHNQHERLQNLEQNAPLVTVDDALDYDRTLDYFPNEESDDEQMLNPYHFPHSTRVGNVLHKVFENWDFAHSLNDEDILDQVCQPLNLAEEWLEPLKLWFTQIVNTPFGDNLTLTAMAKDKRLNEWQFYLRLANEKALPQLNSLLKAESRLAKNLPDLHLVQLEGFVRGFVDMVVQVDGKFYILDYKSNYLGKFEQDYTAEKLEKTMGQYRYDLQYLLYTLALHRYLGSRLGDNYDYDQHFGGVAYLFLRGMNGEPNRGVYFDKPSKALIFAMDELFA